MAALPQPKILSPVAAEELRLVHAAKGGDIQAFDQLVSRYDRRIFKIAQYIVQNREEAEDVVQDSFMKAYANLSGFRGDSRFYTWLVRIVVNDALMKIRRRRVAQTVSLDDDQKESDRGAVLQIADSSPDPEQALHQKELRQTLASGIQHLKPGLRAVFVLRDVQGLSILETAAALGISVPLVKTRLLRARLALRKRVNVFFGPHFVMPRAGYSAARELRMAR